MLTKTMYSIAVKDAPVEVKSKEEKLQMNEKIWEKAEQELEAEEVIDECDEVPPPLPTKDYEAVKVDSIVDKLQTIAALRGDSDEAEVNKSDTEEAVAENAVGVAREYNRTVSDEFNQNTSGVNYNNQQEDIPEQDEPLIIHGEIPEETHGVDDESDEEVVKDTDKKFYAPDSSDEDEEDGNDDDDLDYASREVNFDDDAESEDDESVTKKSVVPKGENFEPAPSLLD